MIRIDYKKTAIINYTYICKSNRSGIVINEFPLRTVFHMYYDYNFDELETILEDIDLMILNSKHRYFGEVLTFLLTYGYTHYVFIKNTTYDII